MERWSLTLNVGQPVDLVAPQVDADRGVGGRREHVDDRAAPRELAAVLDQLLAAVAERRRAVRQARRDRRSSLGRTTIGSTSSRAGAEPLQQRPHAGHDHGRGSARGRAAATAARRRRPIVSTLGLTRSNGSVSQAGNSATCVGSEELRRSSPSWPAIVPVGQATTSGRRFDRPARAAIEIGRAASGTASRAFGSPSARVSAGLVAQQRGNARKGARVLTRSSVRQCGRQRLTWNCRIANVDALGDDRLHCIGAPRR